MAKDKAAEAKRNEGKSAEYGHKPHRALTTSTTGLTNAIGMGEREMRRDGLRYGDPSQPRYATGRADGAAPAFCWPGENGDFVGHNKRR